MLKKIDLRKRLGLELFRLSHVTTVNEHTLKTLFWESTLRCNMSCRHCGSDCKKESAIPDMPVADFLKVIDEITPHVDPSSLLVIIGGGEALVRKDIESCGLQLYRNGFPWGIVTNGLTLDHKRLDSLLKAGLRTLALSLDGLEPEHNWLRNHPQSFQKAMNAIDLINLEGEGQLVWDVVTCVNQRNLNTLTKFKELLINKGVTHWRIFTIFPSGRAASETELQLTDQQFHELMEFIKATRQEGRIDLKYACEGFLGGYETEVRDSFYRCSAGVSVASILVDGSISGCTSIRSKFYQGNIYQDHFMDIWNNRFEKYRNRDWAKKGICNDCKEFRYCLGGGMHLRDDQENLAHCHFKQHSFLKIKQP